MTEEIKEILDYLKPKYDIVDELGNDYKKVKFKDCKLLLDYITNLQQENGNLKTNEQINVEVHNKQVEIIKGYKSRCEKAIEYIKMYKCDYSPYELTDSALRNVLNILNGSDEK